MDGWQFISGDLDIILLSRKCSFLFLEGESISFDYTDDMVFKENSEVCRFVEQKWD